jgi:dTDP-D-glucose 4,6-dehydratase
LFEHRVMTTGNPYVRWYCRRASTTTAAASSWVADKGRPGEVYNIGGGTELTNKELTHRLLGAVG